ncbi:MAG: AP2/ERF family transcription factor [Planctomycetota bacterium]
MQRQNIKRSRFFADSIYGGKLAALRAAKLFRDKLEASLSKMTVEQKSQAPSVRNQSGIVGVRRHRQKDRRGDFEYHSWTWVAQWTDGHGKRKTRSFAVEKYGEDEAFRLACESRDNGVANAKR